MDELKPREGSDTDESLMRQFQSGAEEAFGILFHKYSKRLINFAYRFLHSQEDAEDVTQEVFLRLYRKKERYNPAWRFRPWIYAIASRLIINRWREKKRHPRVALKGVMDEERTALAEVLEDTSCPGPGEQMESQELAQIVHRALDQLSENQRTAVILARFEEMSYEEISLAMNISAHAVKSLLFRARKRLKTALAPHSPLKNHR